MKPERSAEPLRTADVLRVLMLRQSGPLALLAAIAWFLAQRFAEFDLPSILAAAGDIRPGQWLVAMLATLGSFLAFGRFEAILQRRRGFRMAEGYAQLTGITAAATAQLAGFGLLTGTLARWRMMPGQSLWRVTRLTISVSLSFMLCLAILSAFALAASPLLPNGLRFVFGVASMWIVVIAGLTVWRPRPLFRLSLPPLAAQLHLLALAGADTLLAALALYALLPVGVQPGLLLFYTVFLLSLGAGLVGATPGGVGPFEFAFLACLPQLPAPELLAAIMGFRLIYFACPALLALAVLVVRPGLNRNPPAPVPGLQRVVGDDIPPVKAQALSYLSNRAELGLMRQGAFELLCDARMQPLSLVAEAGQSLIMLSDPMRRGQRPAIALAALADVAGRQLRTPCLYKSGPRMAVVARKAGWRVLRVSDEAWLTPARFDIAAAERRQLRRQLRKAEKAGVTIREARGHALPLAAMRALDRMRAAARGDARGFSMGRFCAFYVAGQLGYLAYVGDRLVGFVTFHESHAERTLDLVCNGPDAPAGTMHLLVTRAIESAGREGCTRLSLAAVPRDWPLQGRLGEAMRARTGSEGLRRFKALFAPDWQPLYIAAPSVCGLLAAALDLTDRITRPREARDPRAGR